MTRNKKKIIHITTFDWLEWPNRVTQKLFKKTKTVALIKAPLTATTPTQGPIHIIKF